MHPTWILLGGAVLVAVLLPLVVGCSPTTSVRGVPNFAEVSPGLYRSGQPATLEAWQYLYDRGVRRVVKLNFDAEGSDDGARSVGMTVYEFSIPPEGDQDAWDDVLGTFKKPDPALVAQALAVMDTAVVEDGVLVHCTHGQDRTGLVVGAWRVRHDGWAKARAFDEMIARGFHPELVGLDSFWLRDVPLPPP